MFDFSSLRHARVETVPHIYELSDAPAPIQSTAKRVTNDLIRCDIRIASRSKLADLRSPRRLPPSSARLNKFELEAASLYASRGYKVIRLEHFAANGVGRSEHLMPESKMLGKKLRKHLTRDAYLRFIQTSDAVSEALVLNEVDPRDYPLNCYPPDFLMVRSKQEFVFVEVKGPRDRLHFRQANWAINLLPKDWRFEICALVERDIPAPEMVLKLHRSSTQKFRDELQAKIAEAQNFRDQFSHSR